MDHISNIDELRRLVDRVSYKRGAKIITTNRNDGPYAANLYFTLPVEDVHNEGITQNLTVSRTVYFPQAVEAVKQLIRSGWHELETHELNEWLKIDGEWITDPHPELRGTYES